jgi:formylglycine-generating enzyme required for sulfatase activity
MFGSGRRIVGTATIMRPRTVPHEQTEIAPYTFFTGGSWHFDPWGLRSAFRVWGDDRYINTGFRVARTLTL